MEYGVKVANRFNSTMFTECCDVAILPHQTKCPSCGTLIVGHDCKDDNETRVKRWNYAKSHGNPANFK